MSELFEIPQALSPRLQWMAAHGLVTNPKIFDDTDEDYRWGAWKGADANDCSTARYIGHGETERDALTDWAVKNKIKLWNEA